MAEETLFTKIIKGEIPSTFVYKDDTVVAFKDIEPKAEHHIIIVPKKPIPSIAHCEPEDENLMGHMFTVARKIAEDLGVAETGYRLMVNVGPDGGQSVPHLHMHLLAGGELGFLGFPANFKG